MALARNRAVLVLPLIRCVGLVSAVMTLLAGLSCLAQIPDDLQGKWSTNQSSCNPSREKVMVFEIGSKTVSWYEVDCDISNGRRMKNGVILGVDCEKGGGIKGSGSIVIQRTDSNVIDVAIPATSFSASLKYRLRRCSESE
jgi:hypothetical protein